MLRPASRCLLRHLAYSVRPQTHFRSLGTAPPHLRPRSWRSSAARWGIAAAGIYFYNTSPLFAQEPDIDDVSAPHADESSLPTLASLSPSSRFQPPSPSDPATVPLSPTSSSPPSIDPKAPPPPPSDSTDAQSPQALEEEASSQGAFNEETGEINWDCPCLGGMAHGPCGEEFRAAFSCFVYSKEEPKGMDCIERFKGMQHCFREHPDVYGEELAEEDEEGLRDGPEGSRPTGVPGERAEGQGGPPIAEGHGAQVRKDVVGEKKDLPPAATKA